MISLRKNRLIAKVAIFDGIAYQTEDYIPKTYLGDPINICNILSDQGCQEINLVFPFAPPSIEGVKQILSVARAPTAVGGYGSNIKTCQQLLSCGAEKIILSDSILDDVKSIDELASYIGAQAIACSIDYRIENGVRYIYSGLGRKLKRGKLADFLYQLPTQNFGELILSCISSDGSLSGLDGDLHFLGKIEKPILISGGFDGRLPKGNSFDGVVASSKLFLCGNLKAPLINYPDEFSIK